MQDVIRPSMNTVEKRSKPSWVLSYTCIELDQSGYEGVADTSCILKWERWKHVITYTPSIPFYMVLSILGRLKMFVDCCKIKATLRGIGYITLSKMRKKNTEPYHILQRGNRGRIWSKLSLLKLCANLRRPQPRWNLKQKNYKFLFTT